MQKIAIKKPKPAPPQRVGLVLACLRGIGEFASLQSWRLRDRFARRA